MVDGWLAVWQCGSQAAFTVLGAGCWESSRAGFFCPRSLFSFCLVAHETVIRYTDKISEPLPRVGSSNPPPMNFTLDLDLIQQPGQQFN
jgi:hypothetical protein